MLDLEITTEKQYEELGFCSVSDLIKPYYLENIEQALKSLIWAAASRLPEEKKEHFYDYNFDDSSLLHQGIIKLYELDPKLESYVVDGICNSRVLYDLITDDAIGELSAKLIGTKPSNLSMGYLFMRVDLPDSFEDHRQKIRLPYHQESSYFRYNLSADSGLVLWIPLFDCAPEDGALEVCIGSHKQGMIEHDSFYANPKQKRHLRTFVNDDITKEYEQHTMNVKRGSVTVQHFNLLHRSGSNIRPNRVRYTMLARCSNLLAPDFLPISWK
jgi:hypothetical protein